MPIVAATSTAALTYLLVAGSLHWLRIPGQSSPIWWAATGIAVVVLVRCPRRWWVLLVVGYITGYLLANRQVNSWPVAITYVLAGAVELVVASGLLVGRGRFSSRRLGTAAEAARFAVATAAAIGFGTLLILITAALFPLHAEPDSFLMGYLTAHLIGMLLVGPLLMPDSPLVGRRRGRELEFAAVLLLTAGLSIWVFVTPPFQDVRGFPVLLPIVWAGIRLDAWRATIVTLLAASLAAGGAAHGAGTFSQITDPIARSVSVQLLVATMGITMLALVIITRHREELAARARDGQQTLFRAIRDSLVAMYSIRLDRQRFGQIYDANPALGQMLGYRPADLEGEHCSILGARGNEEEMRRLRDYLDELAHGKIEGYREESRFYKADGTPLWVQTNATSVQPATEPPFALVQVYDLTQREEHRRTLERMALHDALTGLANRSLLFTRLDEVLGGVRAGDGAAGLLYLDLDGFKPINDQHGHDAGDTVLVEIARRLSQAMRPQDLVARLGGDEFAVLCPSVEDPVTLEAISLRLRALVREPIGLPTGPEVSVDVSIGAAITHGNESSDSLIRRADRAMYEAKEAQRSRA